MSPRAAITPAGIDFSDPAAPRAMAFDDVYHSRAGAAAQARHVFLGGNRLPERWRRRRRFVVLETGFGLGNNFIATWAAWRDDPDRCDTLWFVAIEKHPPTRADLQRAHAFAGSAPEAEALAAAWPPLVGGLHLLDFEGGCVRLLLAFGDVQAMLRELVLQADAFYLDGFAPARNPEMWQRGLWPALARLAAPEATAATWSVAREVRDGLAAAGFVVEKAPGFGGKREITVARFAPRHQAMRPAGRIAAASAGSGRPQALIVGAGLAGASAAHALARAGWDCTVIERGAAAAQQASGNRAGLFHGLVHGADGPHARLLRASALHLQRSLGPWIADGEVEGAIDGLLRVEAPGRDAAALAREAKQALGFALPDSVAQALTPAQAAQRAGVALDRAAWLAPGGGWLAPASLVDAWLVRSGARLITNAEVDRVERSDGRWVAHDPAGRTIAGADVLVLANAADAARLAGLQAGWPLRAVRGQLTQIAAGAALPKVRIPLAGNGTLVALPEGGWLAGATSQPDDADPEPRPADDLQNLAQLSRLLGRPVEIEARDLCGRVGWRCSTDDRLPLVGPVPAGAASSEDRPRHFARLPGLYVFSALGSRGITLAPLAGEVLASWICGAPIPLEASLLDAIDPARFAARAVRRAASRKPAS